MGAFGAKIRVEPNLEGIFFDQGVNYLQFVLDSATACLNSKSSFVACRVASDHVLERPEQLSKLPNLKLAPQAE